MKALNCQRHFFKAWGFSILQRPYHALKSVLHYQKDSSHDEASQSSGQGYLSLFDQFWGRYESIRCPVIIDDGLDSGEALLLYLSKTLLTSTLSRVPTPSKSINQQPNPLSIHIFSFSIILNLTISVKKGWLIVCFKPPCLNESTTIRIERNTKHKHNLNNQ